MKIPHASAREILIVAGGALLCLGGAVAAMRIARSDTAGALPRSPIGMALAARADDLSLKERLDEILRAENHYERLEALATNLSAAEIAVTLVLADQIEDRRDQSRQKLLGASDPIQNRLTY